MRPINRRESPISTNFANYPDAFPELASRIGLYCSYCERRIPTNLAIEHIQPKGLPQYRHLLGNWGNFLLACVNCNATKGDKEVLLDTIYLPDRDNTFAVFVYSADGMLAPATSLGETELRVAQATLALTGLDRRSSEVRNENGRLVALDRVRQRAEVWGIAAESLADLQSGSTEEVRRQIVRTALASGFFSIWMQVFAADTEMRSRFIQAFPGTATDCFDAATLPISPRPPNGLLHCGKI